MRICLVASCLIAGCYGPSPKQHVQSDARGWEPVPLCSLTHGTPVYGADADCATLDIVANTSLNMMAEAGYDVTDQISDVSVTVSAAGKFDCGGVETIGCTRGNDIEITSWVPPEGDLFDYGSSCYELVLTHEIVHWGLSAAGRYSDPYHLDPGLFGAWDSLAQKIWREAEAAGCNQK